MTPISVRTRRRSVYSSSFSVLNVSGQRSTLVHWRCICFEGTRDERNLLRSWKVSRLRWAQGENVSMWLECSLGQRSTLISDGHKKEGAVECRAQGAHRGDSKSVKHIQRLRFPVTSRCSIILRLNETVFVDTHGILAVDESSTLLYKGKHNTKLGKKYNRNVLFVWFMFCSTLSPQQWIF